LYGIGYAAGYFFICVILKLISEATSGKNNSEISVQELLKDVKITKK